MLKDAHREDMCQSLCGWEGSPVYHEGCLLVPKSEIIRGKERHFCAVLAWCLMHQVNLQRMGL